MQRYCFRPAPTHPYLEYPPPPPQPTIIEEPVKDPAGKPIGTISVKKDAKGKLISRTLTVSSLLKAVPPSAFANLKLTAVIIPRTVGAVGAGAFKGNPDIKSVVIAQSLLNKISADAFPSSAVFTDHSSKVITRWVTEVTTDADGSKITLVKDNNGRGKIISKTLDISSTLTAVPASKFANQGFTAIRIPPETTSIGSRAFADNRLTALTIPQTVTAVGTEAFKGNPGLKSVIISQGLLNKTSADTFPSSAVFTDHSGKVITRWVTEVTTDADGSKITLVKDNNGNVISKTLELSSTVTAVPASKFANKELTAIRIPPKPPPSETRPSPTTS